MSDSESLKSLMLVLADNTRVSELLSNPIFNLSGEQVGQASKILSSLSSAGKGGFIDTLSTELQKILSDGKVEVHEIPILVNAVHDALLQVNLRQITTKDIGVLIKVLLVVMMDCKVIQITSEDYSMICRVIDISVVLLQKKIKLPTKCICF
jgi:hypothetical protein